jgi:hypothetical protein
MSPGQSLVSAILTLSLWSTCVCASPEEQASGYTIQVAAFPESAESEAEKFVLKLTDSGEQPVWGLIEIPGKGQWMRVFIGSFESAAQARQYGDRLIVRRIIKEFVIKKSSEIKMLSRPRSVGRKEGRALQISGTILPVEDNFSASGKLEKNARIPVVNNAKPPPEKLRPPLLSTRPPTTDGNTRQSQSPKNQNLPHPNQQALQTLYHPTATSQAALVKSSKERLIDVGGVAKARYPVTAKGNSVAALKKYSGRNPAIESTATLATLRSAEIFPQLKTTKTSLWKLAPVADVHSIPNADPLKLALRLITSLSSEKSLPQTTGGLWLSGDKEEGLARLQWIIGKDCAALLTLDNEGKVQLNAGRLAELAGAKQIAPVLAPLVMLDYISSNEGLLLLVQLTQGTYRYGLHLGRQTPTAGGNAVVNGSLNLDNNFDSRINPYRRLHKKIDIEKPPAGFDGMIAINPEARWFNLPSNRWVQVGTITFHELSEAHAKVDTGLEYLPSRGLPGAHDIALEREMRLKAQRPSANLVVTVGSNRMLKSEDEMRQFYAETNNLRQQ